MDFKKLFSNLFAKHEEKIREWAKKRYTPERTCQSAEMCTDMLEKITLDTIELNEEKLLNALNKKLSGLNIVKAEEIHSNIGNQGIEGCYNLTIDNGTEGLIETQSIFAGGYNVQCLHYRYLVKVSKKLEENRKPVEVVFTEDQERIISYFVDEIKNINIEKPVFMNRKLARYTHGRTCSFLTKLKYFETRYYSIGIGITKCLFVTSKGLEFFKSKIPQ